MLFNLENLVSITEANRNFSSVARLVDEKGPVVILKNNEPRYVLLSFDTLQGESLSDEEILEISKKAFKSHEQAYRKLSDS
jgi:antitoxin Phd